MASARSRTLICRNALLLVAGLCVCVALLTGCQAWMLLVAPVVGLWILLIIDCKWFPAFDYDYLAVRMFEPGDQPWRSQFNAAFFLIASFLLIDGLGLLLLFLVFALVDKRPAWSSLALLFMTLATQLALSAVFSPEDSAPEAASPSEPTQKERSKTRTKRTETDERRTQ